MLIYEAAILGENKSLVGSGFLRERKLFFRKVGWGSLVPRSSCNILN